MLKPALIAAVAIAALPACTHAPETTHALQSSSELDERTATHPEEEIDLFTLAIETGRWNVIIDNARNGAREAPLDDRDESLTLRSDRSLKAGVLELIQLRNELCAADLATGSDCTLPEIPAWAFEPPTADTDPQTLQRRSEWLGSALGDLTSIGCAAGVAATGDERYCAVE